jgi:hypothetical protein
MIISLGYDERTDSFILKEENLIKINLRNFTETNSFNTDIIFKNSLAKIFNEYNTIKYLQSFEILNRDIILSARRGNILENNVVDRIHELIKIFTNFCRKEQKLSVNYWPLSQEIKPEKYSDTSRWGKSLYVRYGNVELRVIESFLRRPTELFKGLEEIKNNIDSNDYMYGARSTSKGSWFDSSDVDFCLRKLITNAGFYPSLISNDYSLDKWCNMYLDALTNSEYLFSYSGAYPNFWVTQNLLLKNDKKISYQNFPSLNKFYSYLAENKILFVTPFYEQINHLYETGNIFHLYKNQQLPFFEIKAIKADVSTYPNRPHESWFESFQMLMNRVDDAFKTETPDIFFASCGCYGLPICNYVFKRYGCTSIYYGNHINTLFGIRQQCSEGWLPEERNLKNWANSNLGKYKNINMIDGGRYL